MELVRYIHLNPVRAGLVEEPLDYPWSGHRAYLGKEHVPWLSSDGVLSQFDDRLGIARRRYRAFVRGGNKEGYREDFHSGGEDARILGDDGFLASVLKESGQRAKPPDLDGVVRAVCTAYGLSPADLRAPGQSRLASEARAVIGWLARELGSATFVAVGGVVGRDVSTVSSAVRRLSERVRRDPALSRRLETIKATWTP